MNVKLVVHFRLLHISQSDCVTESSDSDKDSYGLFVWICVFSDDARPTFVIQLYQDQNIFQQVSISWLITITTDSLIDGDVWQQRMS